MFERRAHIRIPVGLHGRYQLARKMGSPRLGLTQDVSLGGMQLACTEQLEPGERIAIDLPLPKEGEVGLTGVVLWSRKSQGMGGYEVGLRWTGLEPSAQARLNSFITGYTRPRAGDFTSAVVDQEPPVSWPRTLALALFLSTALLVGANLWFSWQEMKAQDRVLQQSIASQELYQSRFSR